VIERANYKNEWDADLHGLGGFARMNLKMSWRACRLS
jgi:hypothetical protein